MIKNQSGFTLLEIALVILISGFVMIAAAEAIKLYTINLKYDKTLKHLKITQSAINEFYGLEGRYPCPADPTLPPSHSGYGIEQCRSSADLTNNTDSCNGAPANLFCPAQGTIFSRDGDQNGQPDIVMIGIVPFRTLYENIKYTPYSENYRLDGYSTYLSYAVTEHMTNRFIHNVLNPANPNTGGIRIEDENNISLTVPPNSAHYALYSHGDNRKGGYSSAGVMIDNCLVSLIPGNPPAPAAPGPTAAGSNIDDEIENCDNNDAIFRKGIRSIANNNNYNDDVLFFKATGARSLWKTSLANQNHIYNTNLGNVGVGTQNPTHTLHVAGDLSAQTSTVSNSYCDGVSTDCLLPSAIAGNGTAQSESGAIQDRCPPNEVAYAIHENRIVCRRVNWVMNEQDCPSGEYLVGISNTGVIRCALPN